MPKKIEKLSAESAPEVRSSGQLMLLFFALLFPLCLLGLDFFGSAHAQSSPKGWSVSPDVEANIPAATETEPRLERPTDADVLDQAKEDSEPVEEQAVSDKFSNTDDVEPAQTIATSPVIDLDPQLRDNLERQLKQIIEIQENEDAFSENLGEAYLGYGQALQRAGRLDEARKMFANALHIAKINNGVNSIEQRPVLLAMFELNFAQGDPDGARESEKRIRWLEKKYPEARDNFSFEIVVRLGNLYLDSYLSQPSTSQAGQLHLKRAGDYLEYAINRYGAAPMDELFMPYGELALVYFLKSTIRVEVERPNYDKLRNRSILLEGDRYADKKPRTRRNPSSGRAEYFLREYLAKARAENRTEDVVLALIGLGDTNLLFERKSGASHYYEQAWTEAQELESDHRIVMSFQQPQVIPAFNYSRKRTKVQGAVDTLVVPASLTVNELGKVRRYTSLAGETLSVATSKRAKRAARRLRFRPVIENGKMVAPKEFTHEVEVKVRRSNVENRG